ncbi:hypothetical protein SAMN04487846_0156 [Microbacterium sp. cf046]|uniref:SCO7613 C-terminal domain-containing membrane protein n=1 Tax=Microbacterium sp. cf046 TaxID=1761803 RepID=UPI0008ED7DB5|nr:hypothetical protein [Microbacterium sp. cf046]SFR87410.1 hypothetical protein SAMN04487846_0156 [Microbacterium sp. cf046]
MLQLGRAIVVAEADRQRLIEAVRLDYRRAPAPSFAPVPEPVPSPAAEAPPSPVPTTVGFAEPIPPGPLLWQLPTAVGAASTTHVAEPLPAAEPALVGATALAAPPLASSVPAQSPPPVGPAQPPASVAPPQPAPEPRAPRRRLSVPVLLLIVGVSLVGVAAVFFLVYAWFTWGIGVRALIIGAITVATIGIASLLRRRSLTATAEGIAVLGVLLLALDAWAVRANDFFGTAAIEPALYYGVSVIVVGLLCRVWAKLSALRSPDLAAVLALPVGLGLVIGGATSLPTGEAIVAGLLGAAAGGLAHRLPAPWSSARARTDSVPEQVTLAVIGVAALVAAAVLAAFVSPDSVAFALWSGAAIVALGALHAVLLRPHGGAEPLPAAPLIAGVASSVAAAVAAILGWQLAYRADFPAYSLLVGPLIAVAVPVVLDRFHRRLGDVRPARVTAAVLGGLSLVATLGWWAVLAGLSISLDWVTWRTDAVAAPLHQAEGAWFAAIAGVLIAVLLFAAPTLSRPGLRNLRIVIAAVVLLMGVAVAAIPALIVGAAVLVAAGAILALTRPPLRIGGAIAAAIAAGTAFLVGTTAPWLWLIAVLFAVAVPIAAQLVVRPAGPAAAWLTFAPVGVATVAAFLAPSALAEVTGATTDTMTAFVLVQWIALAALLCAVVIRLGQEGRSTLAVSAYALFGLSLLPYGIAATGGLGAFKSADAASGSGGALGEPALAVARSIALLALLALVALRRTRVAAAPALGGAALVPAGAAYATFAVLQTFGLEEHGARAIATVGAAVTVVCLAAVWSMLRPSVASVTVTPGGPSEAVEPTTAAGAAGATTRAMVDLGALAVVTALAWDVPEDLRWAMLAVVSLGFIGASLSRGWAAPASASTAGIPSTRASGVLTGAAPRRLLAWPAFALATAALWAGLWSSPGASSLTVEAFVLAPAIALLAFSALLVWLRRLPESAVAVTASLLLGLAVPALAGWTGSLVRGTVVALVSAAIALLLTCAPALRARIPALSGATTALFALALVTVQRAVDGAFDDIAVQSAWLLLLVVIAYAAALGAARPLRGTGRQGSYSAIVPPLTLAVATVAGLLAADDVAVLIVALVALAALHVAASAVGRNPLGAPTRWTALASAAAFAVTGFMAGAFTIDATPIIELASLPVALTVLAGSASAQWRRRQEAPGATDGERIVWLAGLTLAVAPSIIAPIEPLRVWLVVIVPLAAALVAVLLPIGAVFGLRIWSALVLTAGSVLMGGRTLAIAGFESAESAVLVSGAGAILVAAALTFAAGRRSDSERTAAGLAVAIALAGAALLLAAVVVLSDGQLARTTVTATVAAVVAVGGAALLGSERWRSLGAVLAVGGFVASLVAIGARLIIVFDTAGATVEPDLWAVIALGITAAIGIMALRSTAATLLAARVAAVVGVGFAIALAFFAAAEGVLLGATAGDELRTLFTMTALTVAGFGGVLLRDRLGLALPIVAAAAAGVFGLVALTVFSVSPVELVTVVPALGLLALGARALRRKPQARTWPTLGPGLALLTLPPLLYDFFGETELWRAVGLGVVAIALVVVGAVWRLQAPLVLGSVVLLTHGIAQLWPWISSAYVYVPWWLWLGVGGALLIYLAARYEKNMRALRTSFTAVASLR